MDIKWLDDADPRPTEDPLIALIAHDGTHAYVSLLDEGYEHYLLYRKMTGTDDGFDNYYRIIIDSDGADWTFVCPNSYKSISNKEHRIKTFYEEGYKTISEFLETIGYSQKIEIPKRYSRHLDYLTNGLY